MMRIFRHWIIVLSLLSSTSLSYAENPSIKFDDISILVPSCDKYSELWPIFFKCLFKHWPSLQTLNKDIPIFLISNKVRHDDPRVNVIYIPDEKSWSGNMITAMQSIKTKYVMILLEDYIFDMAVNEERLQEIMQGVRKLDAAYVSLGYFIMDDFDENYFYDLLIRETSGDFRNCLQACIFESRILCTLLVPGESAWDFEIAGNIRSRQIGAPFLQLARHGIAALSYRNASNLGHINQSFINCARDQGMPITFKRLPIKNDF